MRRPVARRQAVHEVLAEASEGRVLRRNLVVGSQRAPGSAALDNFHDVPVPAPPEAVLSRSGGEPECAVPREDTPGRRRIGRGGKARSGLGSLHRVAATGEAGGIPAVVLLKLRLALLMVLRGRLMLL